LSFQRLALKLCRVAVMIVIENFLLDPLYIDFSAILAGFTFFIYLQCVLSVAITSSLGLPQNCDTTSLITIVIILLTVFRIDIKN
jgi:hypothetical protein